MLHPRSIMLAALVLSAAVAPLAHGQEAAPTPQVQIDMVMAQLSLPRAERSQILSTVAGTWTRADRTRLAQYGVVEWTGQDRQQTFETVGRLRDRGLARMLACPKVVALSGSEAAFLSGAKIAVPAMDTEANADHYEPYGTQVTLLPTVVADGRIKLSINVTQSNVVDHAPDVAVAGRCAKVFTELESGETIYLLTPHTGPRFVNEEGHAVTHMLYIITPHVVTSRTCGEFGTLFFGVR